VWVSSIADIALIFGNTSDRQIAWTIPKPLISVQIFLLGTKLISSPGLKYCPPSLILIKNSGRLHRRRTSSSHSLL